MIPTLLLTPDESRDRSGPVTPTLTGLDRVRPAGVPITEDLSTAVNLLIGALIAVPVVSGYLTRFFVFSPHTVEEITESPVKINPMHPETWG